MLGMDLAQALAMVDGLGYENYWLGLLGSMARVFLFYEFLARVLIIKNIPLFA